MYRLRQPIYEGTYLADRTSLFSALVGTLAKLGLKIEHQDEDAGEIVVECLTVALNLILWRCWGDKILFELVQTAEKITRLTAYAIPNLFIVIDPREHVVDVRDILAKLPI